MRSNFSFGELGSILQSSKKPDIIKIASSSAGGKVLFAEEMESICRVADALDELGKDDLADELMASVKSLISEKIKTAKLDTKLDEEDEGGELDKEDLPKDEMTIDDDGEETMSVECPHCKKEFDVIVEKEGDKCEVETKEKDDKEKEEGGEEKEKKDEGPVGGMPDLMSAGLSGGKL